MLLGNSITLAITVCCRHTFAIDISYETSSSHRNNNPYSKSEKDYLLFEDANSVKATSLFSVEVKVILG